MFLLIDKPKGYTSHDIVDEVRKITGIKKVGHAGTLDPNATGILVVGVGRESTRKLSNISIGTSKVYEAEVMIGEERDTDDIEGKVVHCDTTNKTPAIDEIKLVLKFFEGEIEQTPPQYSAIKIKGKVAYREARKGNKIEIQPRKIHVYSIEQINYSFPKINFKVKVSSGTYIRSLARDIGRRLGTYAYLSNLKRVEIGTWNVGDAVSISLLTKENWRKYLVAI